MIMDWHLMVFVFSVALAFFSALCVGFWKLLDLLVRPMKDDITEIKNKLESISGKVKTQDDLDLKTNSILNEHTIKCREVMNTAIRSAMENHEQRFHE